MSFRSKQNFVKYTRHHSICRMDRGSEFVGERRKKTSHQFIVQYLRICRIQLLNEGVGVERSISSSNAPRLTRLTSELVT